MKVVLKQDVKSIGKKDELHEVSDGYARNYLLPRGLAVAADAAAVNEVRTKAAASEHHAAEELANAQALAKRKPEPFDPERDYLCAAGRLITDSRGMAALLGLLASHGEMGVLSAPSLDLMRAAGRAGRRRPNRPRAEHCGPARRVSRLFPRRPSGRGLRHVRRIVR